MSNFADFDRYCDEHDIKDDEVGAAFAAWLPTNQLAGTANVNKCLTTRRRRRRINLMFHVFAYDSYYPEGFFGDYHGSFRTLEAAVQCVTTGSASKYESSVIVTENAEGTLVAVEDYG